MTCEVIVMNRTGVAVAGDSAVTLGPKVFHHAQKLFEIAPDIPVAMMNYGCAEFMGVPWSLLFSSFARQRRGQKLERLEDYATEFLHYLENSRNLFPEPVQQKWFKDTVEYYWKANFAPKRRHKGAQPTTAQNNSPRLARLLNKDADIWKHYEPLDGFNAEFVERLLAQNGQILAEIASDLFGSEALDASLHEGLRACVRSMYSKNWFAPGDRSWIVICGMGETEHFPHMVEFKVGSMMGGKLRYVQSDKAAITREDSAVVIPRAQRHTVDMFFRGIDPRLDQQLADHVTGVLKERLSFKGKPSNRKVLDTVRSEFRKKLFEDVFPAYTNPLITAIDAFGPLDLTRTAEVLVSLTALKMRMSVDERETVGGGVDVAFLSKSDGFVWIKHHNQLPNCHG